MELTVTPIAELIGARIIGADTTRITELDVVRQIDDALRQYSVVVIPALHISDDDLVALSRCLGKVVEVKHGSLEGYPEIMTISRDPSVDKLAAMRTANNFWHTDGTSYECPDKATLLTARRAPDVGEGNTEFASTYAAYEALPADEQVRLEGLRVRHTFANAQRYVVPNPTEQQLAMWNRVPGRDHPLVWRRTDGRSSLLIGSTAESIVGMPDDEGKALLAHLNEWATRPEFTLVHEWTEGDLVIFDNTGLLHRSRPYRATSPRLMHRTTLVGDEAAA